MQKQDALPQPLTRPGPRGGGHTRRRMLWVFAHHLHGCGGGRATTTPLLSLLHNPAWHPNAASTPVRPAFSSTALRHALEPWPTDSETLVFHWTIARPLPPPEQPADLCCWGRPGYALTFLRFASFRATPSSNATFRLGMPSAYNAHTNVVSTTNCAPPRSGKPSTTTSDLRASTAPGSGKSMSLTSTLVLTSSCLSANPRRHAVQCKPSGTGCTMMAKGVEETATSATPLREGERLTTAEEHHAKQVRKDGLLTARGNCGEGCCTSSRPSPAI